MSKQIIIKIERDSEDKVKTSVKNEAGDDHALQIMSGVLKLVLNDEKALEHYASLVRAFMDQEAAKIKLEGNDDNV